MNGLSGNNYIYTICIDAAGSIYAAGAFTNSLNDQYVAKFNGTAWSELGGFNNGIAAHDFILSIYSYSAGHIYAAGLFENTSAKRYVARYNGTAWSEVGGLNGFSANNNIASICVNTAGTIYAAGSFTNSSGKRYVAKFSTPTGINTVSENNSFTAFPNPANNVTSVLFGKAISNATIRLINLTGQTVFEKTNQSGNQFILDLSAQPAGIYFIEVSQQDYEWRSKMVKN